MSEQDDNGRYASGDGEDGDFPMSRRELKRLVREEAARDNIRRSFDARQIGGKVFFGLIGGLAAFMLPIYLSWVVTTAVEQGNLRSLQRQQATQAVRDFSMMVSEQRARMNALYETLQFGGSRAAALEKWRDYDRVYLEWETRFEEIKLYFRDFFGLTYSNFMESAAEQALDKYFGVYRRCVAEDFRSRFGESGLALTPSVGLVVRAGDDPVPAVEDIESPTRFQACLARETLNQLGERKIHRHLLSDLEVCQAELYGLLNHFVINNLHCGQVATWRTRFPDDSPASIAGKWKVEVFYDNVMQKCGIVSYTPFSELQDPVDLSDNAYRALCQPLSLNWYEELFPILFDG